MAKKKYVLLSLVTHQKLTKEAYGRKILSLFYDHYPLLAPQYANYCEPINNYVSSPEEALVYWEGDPFLCRRKISIGGWWYVSEDISKIGYLKIKYDWSSKVDWFKLFMELVSMTGAYFGYVHVFTEKEIEPAGAGSAIDCFLRGTPGIHLKKGIPNLGWGHYFGEGYMKEIDVSLLKKHSFDVQKLGEGYVFHITENLADVIEKYDEFDERRKLLKSLFRPDLFQKYERYG